MRLAIALLVFVSCACRTEPTVVTESTYYCGPLVVGSEIELTASGHEVFQTNSWITNTVHIGNSIYVAYTASYNPFPTVSNITFLRKLSLGPMTLGAAVQLFSFAQVPDGGGYEYTTLIRDFGGSIIALMTLFTPDGGGGTDSGGTLGQATTTVGLARLLPNPDDSGTWGAETPAGGHLNLRLTNNFGAANCAVPATEFACGYRFSRAASVYDRKTGRTYTKGSTNAALDVVLDGVLPNQNASNDVFHRNSSPLSTLSNSDGFYITVEGNQHLFDPPVVGGGEGDDEAASKMFIGRGSKHGVIYYVWLYRAFFAQILGGARDTVWTRDVHLQISRDGGTTWSNLSGSTTRPATTRIQTNDSAYRIETGNYRAEYGEWGADVGPDGTLHLLLQRHTPPESGAYTPGTSNVDWLEIIDTAPIDLVHIRFLPNGQRIESSTLLGTGTAQPHRIQLVAGRWGQLLAINEQPLRYNYSSNNGASWSGWVTIRTGDYRLFSQITRDPMDDSLISVIYHGPYNGLLRNQLWLRLLRMG